MLQTNKLDHPNLLTYQFVFYSFCIEQSRMTFKTVFRAVRQPSSHTKQLHHLHLMSISFYLMNVCNCARHLSIFSQLFKYIEVIDKVTVVHIWNASQVMKISLFLNLVLPPQRNRLGPFYSMSLMGIVCLNNFKANGQYYFDHSCETGIFVYF